MIHKLSDRKIKELIRDGYLGRKNDGGGLYLSFEESGQYWLFRYNRFAKSRFLGIGPLHTITMSEARDAALSFRKDLLAGRDPGAVRKAARAAARLEETKAISFEDYAEGYRKSHEAEWKHRTHRAQWENSLKNYVYPVIGEIPVRDVDTSSVLKVLRPLWERGVPETGSRLRARLENVLASAGAEGLRTGDNPARWAGHLDQLLTARSKIKKKQRYPALPYDRVNEFIVELRSCQGVAPVALEFTVLCACRTGDIIGQGEDRQPEMRWTHVNMTERVWTIPKTKNDSELRIPLSDRAMAILKAAKGLDKTIVFPSPSGGPLASGAMSDVVRRLNISRKKRGLPLFTDPKQGGKSATVHGFRSTFRDWAADCTSIPGEVAEMALAHQVADATEAAYRRSDLFIKRRALMEQWATFVDLSPNEKTVVAFAR